MYLGVIRLLGLITQDLVEEIPDFCVLMACVLPRGVQAPL